MIPFLHAPLAWAAAGLVSIPIIIHLLNRRRLHRIDWAAMEFLLAALRKNKRRVRIEQLILLLCRMALMALLAFFLARPLLDEQGFGWLAGALQSEEKIFVLDNSMSMSQKVADRSLMRRATSALSQSLMQVAERSSRDKVTILQTARPNAPLKRGDFIDRDTAASLEQSLKNLEATSTRAHLERTIESLAEYSSNSTSTSAPLPRSISILTDLRMTDWTDGSGEANLDLLGAFERILGEQDRLIILDVGTDTTKNIAIESVDIVGGRPTMGIRTEIQISVKNHGKQPLSNLRVQLSYAPVGGDKSAASTSLAPPITTIAPGSGEVVSIPCTFRSAGQYWATAEISGADDSLRGDNSLSIVLDVVEATEILLVNGEPSSDLWEGETDFLAQILRPTGEASSGLAPTIVVEDNLPRSDLSIYGAIILANVYRLPDDFLQRLGRFVRSGGPLLIFLGDQIDAVVYERDFGGKADEAQPARGLLPARLGELRNQDSSPVQIIPAREHHYFDWIKEGSERMFRRVSFLRYFELEPLPTATSLASFDDGDDSPAILEMSVDAGRVLLFASTADNEWNDWPRDATFFVLMQEMMRKIGHANSHRPVRTAGTRIQMDLDISVYQSKGSTLRNPDYPKTPEKEPIASPRADDPGTYRLTIDDTFQAGLYFLNLTTLNGESEMQAISVRSEPEESDLRRITPQRLLQLYPDLPITVVRDTSSFSDTGRGQFEISDVLIGAFILLLMIEGFLAWRFAHHKRNGKSNVLSEGLASSRRRV